MPVRHVNAHFTFGATYKRYFMSQILQNFFSEGGPQCRLSRLSREEGVGSLRFDDGNVNDNDNATSQ